MKKFIILVVVLIFSLTSFPAYAKDKRRGGDTRGNKQYHYNGYPKQQHRDRGYRDRGRGHGRQKHYRHYGNYHRRPRHHSPNYRGHFNSRHAWNDYYRRHHREYRNERYYRGPDGFLRFGFCERDSGICFSFSIVD